MRAGTQVDRTEVRRVRWHKARNAKVHRPHRWGDADGGRTCLEFQHNATCRASLEGNTNTVLAHNN
jgi:hypothetical protein